MAMIMVILLSLFMATSNGQAISMAPIEIPSTSGSCTAEGREAARDAIYSEVQSLLPLLYPPQCPCGGPGPWRRIAHLNMSDPNQQCPTNWRLVTSPVRACGQDQQVLGVLVILPFSRLMEYRTLACVEELMPFREEHLMHFTPPSKGTILAWKVVYIDGVSLTHGAAGSRQHIWSFVAALYEDDETSFLNGTALAPTPK